LIIFLGGAGHGKLAKPFHQKAPETSLGSELPNATIVPQGGVAADMTRREDELNLIPGNAAGTATPIRLPVCDWSTRKTEGRIKTAVRRTENATPRKEVNTVMAKVAVRHSVSGRGCFTFRQSETHTDAGLERLGHGGDPEPEHAPSALHRPPVAPPAPRPAQQVALSASGRCAPDASHGAVLVMIQISVGHERIGGSALRAPRQK